MLIVLFLTILGINLFLSVREKKVDFVIVVTNVLIFFLISQSRDNVDLLSYLISFDNPYIVEGNPQILFYGMMRLFKQLGYTFFEFREVIVAICLLLMYVFFRKLSLNIHLMYSSYMSFLIFFDYIQFRNFFAATIFYIVLCFVVEGRGKWKIWFAIFVILITLIHSSFWAYLIFLLIPSTEWQKSKMIKVIALSTLIYSIIAVFFRNLIFFTTDIISSVDYDKSQQYAKVSTNLGGLYYIFLHAFLTCTIGYLVQQYKKIPLLVNTLNTNSCFIDKRKSLQMIFYIDLLAFALCPLVVFSITFHRLLRNLFLINIVAFSIVGFKNRPVWVFVLYLLYLLLWMFIGLSGENFQRLVIPLFETNTFCINEISL